MNKIVVLIALAAAVAIGIGKANSARATSQPAALSGNIYRIKTDGSPLPPEFDAALMALVQQGRAELRKGIDGEYYAARGGVQ